MCCCANRGRVRVEECEGGGWERGRGGFFGGAHQEKTAVISIPMVITIKFLVSKRNHPKIGIN